MAVGHAAASVTPGKEKVMNIFRNMKLGAKIMVLIIIGVLGMVALGTMGISAIKQADADMDNMYNRKLQAVDYLGREMTYMTLLKERTVEHLLAPDDSKTTELMNEAISGFEELWTEYAELGMRASNVAPYVPEAKEDWDQFKADILDVAALADEGKSDEAWEAFKVVDSGSADTLNLALQNLKQLADDNAEQLMIETTATSRMQFIMTIVINAVALLILLIFSFIIVGDINKIMKAFKVNCGKMKNGDFRVYEGRIDRKDEFGDLARDLESMKTAVGKLIKDISEASESIAASSEELAASADQSAQASTTVADSSQEVVSLIDGQQIAVKEGNEALERVNESVDRVKAEAARVAENSKTAAEHSLAGRDKVVQTVETIRRVEDIVIESSGMVNRLGERSSEIGKIIDTIASIADQTNLLSLNATIEAARAGEHGRGFAVVAEEVSNLANESQEATEKIASLIRDIQDDTKKVVEAMNSEREAVLEGTKSIEKLSGVFENINNVVLEVSTQMNVVEESIDTMVSETILIQNGVKAINKHSNKIADAMSNVSAATEEQSASTEEIAASSESLAGLAQDQQEAISVFQY